ncbi:hypothetical protein QWM81_20170 [Streptomyces ficellus]|uniref:Integral membrane protein n=1 Tax=Streptomyces ficellus TaxID=1977088 RepID=A0ABT7ZA03_9ACTN|nr:hypothetical protein [Streptomyces ficellus]MDN3296338.1 hypothetical protein [Streptomyces ficellus]
MRRLGYAVLAAECVLLVCLLAGARVPTGVVVVAEVLVVALLVWRRERLLPEPVARLVGHELRLLTSLVRWVARRPHGVGPGARAFGHARDQAAYMYGFAFVCAVETVGMSYLLAAWPVVHGVVLVLDVYTVLFVLGLHAASVTRPHVLSGEALRVRRGGHVDVLIPLERIAAVRHELLFSHPKEDGVLNVAVASQTSVTIELAEPVTAAGLLGRRYPVCAVRCHADDARGLVVALRRGRTGPWPGPGRPG